MQPERWLPVVGYEGHYEVSSFGRVRSLDRIDPRNHPRPAKLMSQSKTHGGYLRVTLTKYGIEKTLKVHRLVLAAFAGPCPDGHEGCHSDGDPSNTRLDNLRWDTKKSNHNDRRRHGTIVNGERHHAAKLTVADVRRIFALHADGLLPHEIGKVIGRVGANHIGEIIKGRKWKHWREHEQEKAA